MRRIVPFALIAALAACAPRVATPVEPTPTPTPIRPTGGLFGVTSNDLIARFGQPNFQVREGSGTKLQWSEHGCVLDAYLYPPEGARGADRVVHVDTRNPSGADLPLDTCLGMLDR